MAPKRKVATTAAAASSESTPSTMPDTASPADGRPLGRSALITAIAGHRGNKEPMYLLQNSTKNELCDRAKFLGIPTSPPPHPLPSSPPTTSSSTGSATHQLQGKVAMIHEIAEKVVHVFDSMDDANKNRIFESSSLDISNACDQGLLCKGHNWKMLVDVDASDKAEFENMIDPSSGAANKTGFLMAVTHPKLTNYCADRMGNIYNRKTEKILKGYQQRDGYIRLEFTTCNRTTIRMFAHNFIFECFFAPKNNKTHDINHKNGVKNCNVLSNLELMNKKDHALVTHAQHPTMGAKTGKSLSHPLLQILQTGEQVPHESINSAARDVPGAYTGNIQKALKSGKTYLNCRWEYKPAPADLENEIWKSLTGDFDGIEVSSKGHIRTATGIVTYGTTTGGGYKCILLKGIRIQVHYLICSAFCGPQPSPEHTVDHKDGDTINNCIDNLRWADKIEQSTNRSYVKGVSAFRMDDGTLFKEWESAALAGRELGISASHISNCCKNPQLSAGKYNWKFTEKIQQ
jgi:hypothetical protein